MQSLKLFLLICFCSMLLATYCTARAAEKTEYDPLRVAAEPKIETLDLTVKDVQRGREIPVHVYLPEERTARPVVLFSHGLGGNDKGSAYLGEQWAARGYVAVFLQHPGSDDSVWKETPKLLRLWAMRDAASLENFMLRVKDVPAVLDALERWNGEKKHVLAGRMDLKKVGMSGHSFGALTTQAVSGESFAEDRVSFTDHRIQAAVVMSPSSPHRGSAEEAFGKVNIPWMLMTGTKDVSPIGQADVKSRLAVFSALLKGDKYELVLEKAEHSAFTDRALPGDQEPRNPNHHRVILALSTAFWDAYLRGDKAALHWLQSDAPRKLLEAKDVWQMK